MSKIEIQADVPLAPLTTLGLGGPARHFARVEDEEELVQALRWAADRGIAAAILGGGSNLIVPDAGYDGLLVQIAMSGLEFRDAGTVEADAGVPWESVVDGAVTRGWAGVECLTGIPGSTGATPIQNVGAYGQEVAEVIRSLRLLRRDTLELEEIDAADCDFGYRDSRFKREPDRFVVCAVRFELRPAGPGSVRYAELEKSLPGEPSLREIRDTVLQLRRRKSMVLDLSDPNHRSAGSFFLNPVVSLEEAERIVEQALREGLVTDAAEVPRYPAGDAGVKLAAGWLIERSGFAKGTRRGPVGISSRHALALVHHGGGTSAELLAFADEIRRRVQERFGVSLEREPRLLG